MNKDKLKSFIQDNLESFEEGEPRPRVWDRIEDEMTGKGGKVIPLSRVLWMAASIVIIFGIGLVFLLNKGNESIQVAEKKVEELNISSFSSDFAEVENYYVTEVNLKLKELDNYEVDSELLEEIGLLQAEFDQLKKEMGISVDPKRVIEAMIENYRIRLEILEDLLEEIRESHKEFKNKEIGNNEMV